MGGHGGAREGAGRKPNREKHAPAVESFNQQCADYLPTAFENLRERAEGGQAVKCKYRPAGMITRKDVARDADGGVIRDDRGKPTTVDVLVYPDLEPDFPVLVEKEVVDYEPDTKANEVLVYAVTGRPTQAVEMSGEDGGPLKIVVEYADARDPAEDAEAPPGPGEDPPGAEAV